MENRQQALYWIELVQLKVDCEYIRRYRDSLATTTTRFAVARSVVSVAALGTWAATNIYPKVWPAIIVAVQVAEAIQAAIPYAARLRGTTTLSASLDALFIDCQMEWEEIFAGRMDEEEITKRRHKLMTLRHAADTKSLPNALPRRDPLLRLAEADADAYFRHMLLIEG